MLEILKFMVSIFWVFVGCTIIICIVCDTILHLFRRLTVFLVVLVKGYPPSQVGAAYDFIDDDEHEEQ